MQYHKHIKHIYSTVGNRRHVAVTTGPSLTHRTPNEYPSPTKQRPSTGDADAKKSVWRCWSAHALHNITIILYGL